MVLLSYSIQHISSQHYKYHSLQKAIDNNKVLNNTIGSKSVFVPINKTFFPFSIWLIISFNHLNEDGSVRLITDNLLDDKAPYKKTVPNIEDAGNVLLSTSTIKETLNDFYNNTLSDYQKYVVDSSFCSENTYYIEEENKKLFTSYNRIINETTASLACSGTLEQSKVGLLSIDEAIYAGASKNGTNTFS